jgi:hypothetical protein
MFAELVTEIAGLPALLEAPHNWILLRILLGDTTAEIADGLNAWRAVGPDESRRLVRQTKRMVRSVIEGDGEALRAHLARNKKRKNPWDTAPPPNKCSIRVEACSHLYASGVSRAGLLGTFSPGACQSRPMAIVRVDSAMRILVLRYNRKLWIRSEK